MIVSLLLLVASASSSPATWVNFHEPASFDTSEMNWDLADYGEDDPNQPIVPTVSFIDGSDSNVTVIPLSGHETFNENATIVPLEDRIVGGTAAPSSVFDWQVHLWSTQGGVCGGTLISSQHVLTAAHCNSRFESMRVCAGSRTFRDCAGGQVRWVSYINLHPSYNRNFEIASGSDIAVLRMNSRFNLNNNVGIARLWTSFVGNGVRLTVAGWGQTSANGNVSPVLKMAGVVTTSCPSNLFIPNLPSPSSIFCTAAANPNPGRHCFGDSGGFVGGSAGGRAVVVGVVSFGDCTNVSGSTRVSFFTSFIRSACGNCQ